MEFGKLELSKKEDLISGYSALAFLKDETTLMAKGVCMVRNQCWCVGK